MTRLRLVLVVVVVLLLLLLLGGAGAWYYLHGANAVAAADLVPEDTVFFATIPNSADLVTGYQTSQLKTLIESPNMKPAADAIQQRIGDKEMDLINAFLPNLIGQSFIAVTHYDADHPEKTGFVAAMKPKPGLDNFDAFVEKLKNDYPDELKDAKSGTGNVAGVDYQYLQGPGAQDKICVAQVGGWIVTTWGEASLQDWVERYQKKSSTPSLSQNADYQKSLTRIGPDSLALVYFNYHVLVDLLIKATAKAPGASPALTDLLQKKFGAIGGAAIGMHFENGEIVDRFSLMIPRQAQTDLGMSAAPCAYETLNFSGPDTLLYLARNVDWKQSWQTLKDQEKAMAATLPANSVPPPQVSTLIENWVQGAGLDLQHNILDALGPEVSVQMDWSDDTSYPEIGLFVKLDKPDDFQPVIKAVVDMVHKATENQAVINEINSNGHNFASLKYVTKPIPFSPTITEDGPYLGIFLTAQQAVRSFTRADALELSHNKDFMRQIGDKRNGTEELIFLDSPRLLDKTYRSVLPYLSMAAMFNPTLAAALHGHDLPPDLTWLAPIGTWSVVASLDDDGCTGYSISGVGNQGLFYGTTLLAGIEGAQAMGYLPFARSAAAQPQATINLGPNAQISGSVNATVDLTTNAAPAAPAAPDASAPAASSASNSPPSDATTNTAAPATTSSNANPSTPATGN
jgi:hypothetical protein